MGPPSTQTVVEADDTIRLSKSIAGQIAFAMKDATECKAVKDSSKFGPALCAELKKMASLPTGYDVKKCTISTTCTDAKTVSSFKMLGLTDTEATTAKKNIQGKTATELGTALKAALDSDEKTKVGTKTDPTESIVVTVAVDADAKSDMETHVVYGLAEAAECDKVKKSTKTSKFVEKLCASIKTFGSLDDTVAKTCTVSTTCDTKTAT